MELSRLRWVGCYLQGAHMPTEEQGHIVETAVQARGGFLDRPILVVLVASTALVIVGFVLAYLGVVKF